MRSTIRTVDAATPRASRGRPPRRTTSTTGYAVARPLGSRFGRLILITSGLLTWTALPLVAQAQGPAFLVKDINSIQSSAPADLTSFDGKVFFSVRDLHAGPGLWRSDGTAEGTARIEEGAVGPLAPTDGALFFVVGSDDGEELWSIDGTETAVRLTTFSGRVTESKDVNGTLFFVVSNYNFELWSDGPGPSGDPGVPSGNSELWKSDGTVAGTLQLWALPAYVAGPFELTDVNGTLFFVVADLIYFPRGAVWKSDGTVAGTAQLTSFAGAELTDVDGTLFFTTGGVLWRSDGTANGAALIDAGFSAISALTNVNGSLFFVADGRGNTGIWKSDGTAAGTVRVADFPPFASECAAWHRCGLTVANGTLFFTVNDDTGIWLGSSDGTLAGTRLVRHFSALSDSPVDIGGTLYFLADDGNTGAELWRSDGSEAGTALVKDIHRGPASSMPSDLTDVDGTLFFVADEGSTGCEIWRSDGTEAGTVRVTDILHDTHGSNPADLTDVNGTLLFVADDGRTGAELWRSDGTPAGTRLVKDIRPVVGAFDPYLAPFHPTEVSGTWFFAADDGSHGAELWRSDGTESGTVLVKDVRPGVGGSDPFHLTEAGGTLFFWADDHRRYGIELWKSDGTPAGTVLVRDINPGYGPSRVHDCYGLWCGEPTEVNGTLFFLASDGSTARQLWKTDGTAAGTVRVKDIDVGVDTSVYGVDLIDVHGTLFLVFLELSEDGFAYVIWKSDGTDNGTVRIADIHIPEGFPNQLPTIVNGTLFLFSSSHELWRSDGTAAGTVPVRDLGPNFFVSNLTNLEGALVFIGSDQSVGAMQLWRSDGTEAGTVLVKQLPEGPLYSPLTNVNGLLLFTLGGEIWQSDGTEAGTGPIQDLGPLVEPPSSFTLAGGRVFFSADAGGTGTELWALPLATSCRGDCSADGAVTISDLITAVNIALGRVPLSACQSLDTDDGGSVTVGEIVAAVNEVLQGCTWRIP